MSLTGGPDGGPNKAGIPIGDLAAGMFAAYAVAAALYERERSGEGQFIDTSMLGGQVALLSYQAGAYFATGRPPGRVGTRHSQIAPYETFARDPMARPVIDTATALMQALVSLTVPEGRA